MPDKLNLQVIAGGKKWLIEVEVNEDISDIDVLLDRKVDEIIEILPGKYYKLVKDGPRKYHLEPYMEIREMLISKEE